MNKWVRGICILLLLIFSISFVFAEGRCVDQNAFLCVPAPATSSADCETGYDFIDNIACASEGEDGTADPSQVWVNTPVDAPPGAGCCCVDYTDSNGGPASNYVIVANAGLCTDTSDRSTLFIDEALSGERITSTSACNAACTGSDRADYERRADTCEGQGHVICLRSRAETLNDAIKDLPSFYAETNTDAYVCVENGQCGEEQQSCEVLVENGDYEYCAANQICAPGFGQGSGGSQAQCCVTGNCQAATCTQKGGIYCQIHDGETQGCANPNLLIDAFVSDSTGKPAGFASQCCLGTETSQACKGPTGGTCTDTVETNCRDGIDNDCDGYVDSFDQLDCRGSVFGFITGPASREGLLVKVLNLANGEKVEATTDKDGYYTTYNLETSGNYRVSLSENFVTTPSYQSVTLETTDYQKRADLAITSASTLSTIRGTVKTETGEALTGALVVARGASSRFARTDINGTYEIDNVVRGTYTMEAYFSGYDSVQTNSFAIQVPQYIYDFVLPSADCTADPAAFEIITLTPVKGEKQVRIRWDSERCTNSVSSFKIIRTCVDGSVNCAGTKEVGLVNDPDGREFLDKDPELEWNQTYEYVVEARYDASNEVVPSAPKEITLGNALCEGVYANRDAGFCKILGPDLGFNSVFVGGVQCNQNNQLTRMTGSQSCDPIAETCINTDNGPTCIEKDYCGTNTPLNPFGLFSERSQCYSQDGCYMDRKTSNVDACVTCEPEMTCFDYKTQGACVGTDYVESSTGSGIFRPRVANSLDRASSGDACRVASRGSTCEWQVVDSDLQTGVCVDRASTACDDCNNGESLYGFCDAYTCGKLAGSSSGDSCFLSETQLFCNSCSQTTCYDYTNKDSFEASVCDVPNCECTGSTCFKDSGNDIQLADGQDDCSSSNNPPLDTSVILPSICAQDRTEPKTYVLAPEQMALDGGENSKIFFAVVDIGTKVIDRPPAKYTKFCVKEASQDWCTQESQFLSTNESFVLLESSMFQETTGWTFTTGDLELYYYSVDHANNVEPLQSTSFNLDTSPPTLTNFTYEEFYDSDTGFSVLNAVVKTAEHATCNLQLLTGTDSAVDPSIRPAGASKEHVFIFNSVRPGVYQAKIVCNDQVGNSLTDETYPVFVEGSGKIGNYKPFRVTDINPVLLEITTESGMNCRVRRSVVIGDEKSYDAIGSQGDMNRLIDGQTTTHTYSIGSLVSGTYTYQFACIDGSDEYIAYNTFTFDDILPRVFGRDGNNNPYDFSRWSSLHSFQLVCEDGPEGGFGCGRVLYCDLEKPLFDDSTGYCEPNIPYAAGSALEYETPHTVCWKGIESTNGIFGGGKESIVSAENGTCVSVKSDPSLPQLELNRPLPRSTGESYVDISGRVTDGSFYLQDVALRTPDANTQTYDSKPSLFKDFEARGTASINFGGEDETTFDVVFRNTTSGRYILRIETPRISGSGGRETAQSQMYLFYQSGAYSKSSSGSNMELLGSTQLYGYNLDTIDDNPFDFVVRAKNSDLTVQFIQPGFTPVELTATHSGSDAGSIGIVSFDPIKTPDVEVSRLSIVDLIGSEYDIYVRIKADGEDAYRLSDQSFDADPTFEFAFKLSEGALSNGDTFYLQVYAENRVGIRSEAQDLTIVYDTGAPILEDLTIKSLTGENEIEYGQQARVTLEYDDQNISFIQSLTLDIAGFERDVNLDYNTLNPATGVFSTAGIPTGLHSVLVKARDSAGNYVEKQFLNAIRVKRAPGWPEIENMNPLHVTDSKPTIFANFTYVEANDDDNKYLDSCRLTYLDSTGIIRTQTMQSVSNDADDSFTLTLSHDIAQANNAETKTYSIILCRSGTEEIGYGQTIVFDDVRPVIGLGFLDEGAVLVEATNLIKVWELNRGTTFTDSEIQVVASEPVICKMSKLIGSSKDPNYIDRPFGDRDYQDIQTDSFKPTSTYVGVYDRKIECVDRAGLPHDQNGVYRINITGYQPVQLQNIKPGLFSDSKETLFSVRTVPDTDCTLRIGASPATSMQKRSDGGANGRHYYVHERTYVFPVDGEYDYQIDCDFDDNGDVTTYSYEATLLVDSQSPEVTFTQGLPGTSSTRTFVPISGDVNELVNVSLVVNGREIYSANNVTDFAAEIPLVEGANFIDFIVIDRAGNVVTFSQITTRAGSGETYARLLGYSNDVYPLLPETIYGRVYYPKGSESYSLSISGPGLSQSFSGTRNGQNIISFPIFANNPQDGVYELIMTVRDSGQIISKDFGQITINSLAPQNTITNPIHTVEEAVEYILGYTDNLRLRSYVVSDAINVNGTIRDVNGDYLNSVSYTDSIQRVFANVSQQHRFAEGEHLIVFESENDLGITGRASTVALFDDRGPRVLASILGMSNGVVFTKRPTIDIKFHEAAKFMTGDTYLEDSTGRVVNLNLPLADSEQYFSAYSTEPEESLEDQETYKLYIRGVDQYRNEGDTSPVLTFTIESGPPRFVELINPSWGVSQNATDLFSIMIDRPATCRYARFNSATDTNHLEFGRMQVFTETGGLAHSENLTFTSAAQYYYVKCAGVEDDERNEEPLETFVLERITTPPTITKVIVEGLLGGVINDRSISRPEVTVETNQRTICRYARSANIDFDLMSDFGGQTELSREHKQRLEVTQGDNKYFIKCMNGAELFSAEKVQNIRADYEKGESFTIESPKDTNADNVSIQIRSEKALSLTDCTFSLNGTSLTSFESITADGLVLRSESISYPNEGTYELEVTCYYTADNTQTRQIEFDIDRTPPEFISIRTRSRTELDDRLDAEFNFEDNLSGVKEYRYFIGTAVYNDLGYNSVLLDEAVTRDDSPEQKGLDLEDGTTYYWSVKAYDHAGNPTDEYYGSNGTLVDAPDTGGNSGPSCGNGIRDGNEADVDCGGSCATACSVGNLCAVDNDCTTQSCSGLVCQAATCTDQRKNGFESGTDCGGGTCPLCSIGNTCLQDGDCLSGTCDVGICVELTCTNGIRDNDESDVDCGGSCGACSEGKVCAANSDCGSNTCANGVCADPATLDSDGDGMPDFWEEQNGLDPNDPSDGAGDLDSDGLSNLEEYEYKFVNVYGQSTDPLREDSDGDGVDDYKEVREDNTNPLDPSDFLKAFSWAMWLLLFILLLVLSLGGYYGYTVYQDEQKKPKRKTTVTPPPQQYRPMPQPVMRQPKVSLHDQLKKALEERLANEKKLANKGHPVFESDLNTPSSSKTVEETTTEEIIEEREEAAAAAKAKKTRKSSGKSGKSSKTKKPSSDGSALKRLDRIVKSGEAKETPKEDTLSKLKNIGKK